MGERLSTAKGTACTERKIDGTESRKIFNVAAGAIPLSPRWSPDGNPLRFTVFTSTNSHSALWEVSADGRDPHPLLSGWNTFPAECCGTWTPDGKYFLFQSQQDAGSRSPLAQTANIWAIREEASLFRKVS